MGVLVVEVVVMVMVGGSGSWVVAVVMVDGT